MPLYAALVAAGLEHVYRSPVTLHNFAQAGSASDAGLYTADGIAAARPHLVIVAYTVMGRFPAYRDALASLCGAGVVLADVTSLWRDVLARKRVYDLTGNGINHPNDFGHRLYAQVILSLLVDPLDWDPASRRLEAPART